MQYSNAVHYIVKTIYIDVWKLSCLKVEKFLTHGPINDAADIIIWVKMTSDAVIVPTFSN